MTAAVGSVDPDRIVTSQRVYVSAFFEQHLRQRPQPVLNGPSPRHPDVAFIR